MDHPISCIRSETTEESVCPCVLSIRKVSGNEDEIAHHVVECKLQGSSTVLCRSFFPTNSEDPDGRASALRFALCTDSLHAFKSYLRGHCENLEKSRSRHQACWTVYTCIRQNTFCGVYFTAAIFFLLDGSSRSISFKNSQRPKQPVICPIYQFMQSPAFKVWANKVSKVTDESSSSKCKQCGGEVGHEKCLGWGEGKVREDDMCSVCLMIQTEKIYTIGLEEQQLEGMQCLDDLLKEARSTYIGFGYNTCWVCGCDDNEDLDNLVPCPCNNSNALVHSSCAATCKPLEVSMLGPASSCIMCGSSQAVMKAQPIRAVDSVGQQSALSMERPRICDGTNAAAYARVEIDSAASCMESKISLSVKHGVKRLGWRFNDAPAVVPIKKRRIQINEASRSPSPQRKQISTEPIPGLENSSSTKLTSESFDFPCSEPKLNSSSSQAVFDSSSTNLSATLHSSKFLLLSTSMCSPKGTSTHSPKSVSEGSKGTSLPLETSPEPIFPVPTSDIELQNLQILKSMPQAPELLTSISKSPSITSPVSNMSVLPEGFSLKPASSFSELHLSTRVTQALLPAPHHAVHTEICGEVPRDVEKGFLGSVVTAVQTELDESQDVEDGELVISKDSNVDDLEVTKESPEVTSQRMNSYIPSGKSSVNGFQDDRSCWDLNTEMELWNKITSTTDSKEILSKNKVDEDKHGLLFEYNRYFKYGPGRKAETTTRSVECNEHGVVEFEGRNVENGMLGNTRSTLMPERAVLVTEMKFSENCAKSTFISEVSREGGPLSSKVGNGNQLLGMAVANEHMNYNISLSMDDDTVVGADLKEFIQHKVYQETYSHVPLGSKTASDCSEGEKNHDENFESRFGSVSVRANRAGWDQLPEGLDNVEDASRSAREPLSRHGHDGAWGSSSLRSPASSSPVGGQHFGSGRDISRDGLSDGRCHNRYRDNRHVEEPSGRRDSFSHTRLPDDIVEDHNRDRSSGSEITGYSSRGRSSEWDDGQTGSKSQRSHGRHWHSGFTSSPNRSTNAVAKDRSFKASSNSAAARNRTDCSGFKFTFGSAHGGREHHFPVAQISPSDRSNFANRVDMMMGLRGREFEPSAGSGDGSLDRYGTSRGKLSKFKSESSVTFHSSDNLKSNRGHRPESRVTSSKLLPASTDSFGHTKRFPVTSRRNKWSNNRRYADGFRDKDYKRYMRRSYNPSGRTSPHVVHGSSLMDERDWQVLAETRRSPDVREDSNPSAYSERFGDDCSGLRRGKRNEDGVHVQSRDAGYERSPRVSDKERDVRGSAYRRDRDEGKRRDVNRLSSRNRSRSGQR